MRVFFPRLGALSGAALLLFAIQVRADAPVAAGVVPAWEKMDSSDGITVFRREIPGDPVIAFRGEGIVSASITRVASVVLDDPRAKEWVDSLEESKLLKMYSPREFLEYTHIGTPIVLKDRDFLTRGKVEADLKDHSLLVTLWSVEDPAYPHSQYVRGVLQGFWKLKSIENGAKTLVIAEMHADPKGDVPKWLVNLFQKSWPHNTLESLRKQVAKTDIKVLPQVADLFK